MKIGLAFSLLAAMACSTAANAATYLFTVNDPDSTLGGQSFTPYYFYLDSSPTPDSFDGSSFSIDGTTYGHTFSDVAVDDTYTFYNDEFGGFDDQENIYLGDVLFTGTTDHPTFILGTYQLDNFGSGATLTISDPTAAVPEPAGWATMALGLGLAGAMMRRRRQKVSVTFA